MIKVYDSMYDSVSNVTCRIIASLVFSTVPTLTIRINDGCGAGNKMNSADCGVLSIAYAYDICSGKDPCASMIAHPSVANWQTAWRTASSHAFWYCMGGRVPE